MLSAGPNGLATCTPVTRMLREQLGAVDAVVAGLGAMIGAGLFAGLAPASALAGRWLLVAIVVAAVAAGCCCCSTCDQSGVFPGSGGGYRYTREQLGRWPARMAGGLYLAGRAAAAAALAGCFGAYVAPDRPALPALGVLVLAVAADAAGVRPPRALTRALTVFVLIVLALVVAACFAIAPPPPTGVPVPSGTPGLDNAAERYQPGKAGQHEQPEAFFLKHFAARFLKVQPFYQCRPRLLLKVRQVFRFV